VNQWLVLVAAAPAESHRRIGELQAALPRNSTAVEHHGLAGETIAQERLIWEDGARGPSRP
jgi:hypothetical protein